MAGRIIQTSESPDHFYSVLTKMARCKVLFVNLSCYSYSNIIDVTLCRIIVALTITTAFNKYDILPSSFRSSMLIFYFMCTIIHIYHNILWDITILVFNGMISSCRYAWQNCRIANTKIRLMPGIRHRRCVRVGEKDRRKERYTLFTTRRGHISFKANVHPRSSFSTLIYRGRVISTVRPRHRIRCTLPI